MLLTSLVPDYKKCNVRMTDCGVVVRVNHHLVPVLTEVLDGVGCSRGAFETRHHELLWKVVRNDLFEERRVEDAQPVGFHLLLEKLTGLLDLLPNDLLYVLHSGSL